MGTKVRRSMAQANERGQEWKCEDGVGALRLGFVMFRKRLHEACVLRRALGRSGFVFIDGRLRLREGWDLSLKVG